MAERIIGIDLGTTNSAIAVLENGTPKLVNIAGQKILPSVVGISPTGELLIGTPARNQWVVSPERTVRSIKRKMGKAETVLMAERQYTPQEISSFILKELKQQAEQQLGDTISRAVITVPAYFNELQRQATIEAGEIAGLKVERIINEPTASALAYGLGKSDDLKVLVYDLGGGTFDVSIIEMNQGVIDVRATAGNNYLGGDDFDELLANLLADEFGREHNIDLRLNHQAWSRLLRAAEEAKIALSDAPVTTIALEFIASDSKNRPLHINQEVTRDQFEDLIADKLAETIVLVDKALADAELEVTEIDRILLVGGSTRIPAVSQRVTEHLEQEPHIEIDPDAAVALGAAVQAAIIAKEDIDTILVDVTPLSLGIEAANISFSGQIVPDRFVPLIRHNTTIPVQKSEQFSTLFPSQDRIHVKVYQGESQIASQNVLLGEFFVDDLKPNRADGLTDVLINFQLDINAILDVSVIERKSGLQVRKQLKATRQRLSSAQIAESQQKLSNVYDISAAAFDDDDDDDLDDYSDEPQQELSAVTDQQKSLDNIDPATQALLAQAAVALAKPNLPPTLIENIRAAVANIHQSFINDQDADLELLCDELVDLLLAVDDIE